MAPSMESGRRRWVRLVPGLILGLMAFALYVLTLPRGVVPGASAYLISHHTGIDPFRPLTHPVWGVLVRAIARLPGPGLGLKLNLLSVLCGASSVWLMWRLTLAIPQDRAWERRKSRSVPASAQAISGVAAAVLLATCVPFWIISNRAHTLSFDVCLLLFSLFLLLRFARSPGVRGACVCAFVYGIGMTEFSTFVVLAPVVGSVFVYLLRKHRLLRIRSASAIAGCLVMGWLNYLVAAWLYTRTPGFAYHEMAGVPEVLLAAWRNQYAELRHGMPGVGWLLVGLVSVLPCLALLLFTKRSRVPPVGSSFLAAVLGALAVAVFFNTGLSPWRLFGGHPLLITPYLLAAVWGGYVAGYGYAFLQPPMDRSVRSPSGVWVTLGRLYLVVLVAVAAVLVARNLPEADGRPCQALCTFVERFVTELKGRQWVLSDGHLADAMRIEGHERGTPIAVLDVRMSRSRPYLRYVASLFAEPRLKSLAGVGLTPLLREWLAKDPGAAPGLAAVSDAELLRAGGWRPVPSGLFYTAGQAPPLATAAMIATHVELRGSLGPLLVAAAAHPADRDKLAAWALTHMSRQANDLGVLLDEEGGTDAALEAYIAARALASDNVSALLNQFSLATRRDLPEKEALRQEFDRVVPGLGRLSLAAIEERYGAVRHPLSYARKGLDRLAAGEPSRAMDEIGRALDLASQVASIRQVVSSADLAEPQLARGERALHRLLAAEPGSPTALLGLARMALGKGDLEGARGHVRRLREAGGDKRAVLMEETRIELAAGNRAAAAEELDQVIESYPLYAPAWVLRAVAAAAAGEDWRLEESLRQIDAIGDASPGVQLPLACIAAARGDLVGAWRRVEVALRTEPGNPCALGLAVQMSLADGDVDRMAALAPRVLSLDPGDAAANHALAVLQIRCGDYELAETSLRASLARRETGAALNDLAFLLHRMGKNDEAMAYAARAVFGSGRAANVLDTRAAILMDLGRLAEAEADAREALKQRPDYPPALLNLARILEARGRFAEARDLVGRLGANRDRLPAEMVGDLDALTERLAKSK